MSGASTLPICKFVVGSSGTGDLGGSECRVEECPHAFLSDNTPDVVELIEATQEDSPERQVGDTAALAGRNSWPPARNLSFTQAFSALRCWRCS